MAATPGNAINVTTNGGAVTFDGTVTFSTVSGAATSTVMIGNGVGSTPSFSATPQITGLGIGAASTGSGLTFDGSNTMANYAVGTFSPTMVGTSTAGTTTYSVQAGYYVRIGASVHINVVLQGSAATGTGIILLGAFPFTIKNQSNGTPIGAAYTSDAWAWSGSRTSLSVSGSVNSTNANFVVCDNTGAASNNNMANAAFNKGFTLVYQI